MSTINATNIKNAASSVTNIILDTNGGITCGSNYDVSDVEGKGIKLQNGNTSSSLNIQTPQSASSSSEAFRVYRGTDVNASISNDGSIVASGSDILINNNKPVFSIDNKIVIADRGNAGATTIELNADGSITAAGGNFEVTSSGYLKINRETGASGVLRGSLNGTQTFSLEADGNITAAGDTQIGGNPSNGENPGLSLRATGEIVMSRAASKDAITLYENGSSTKTFILQSDGVVQSGGDAQGVKGTKLVYGTVYSTNDGGNAVWRGYASGSNQYKSEILGNGNATFVSTFAVNSFLKLDDGSNLDLKKVGLALVALKAAAAASTDYTSLKSAIATALADL